jgi:hypothetical protein
MSRVGRPGDTGDEFERTLLASARDDRMSPRAKHALVMAFAGAGPAGGAVGGAGGALRDAGTEAARFGTSGAASAGLAMAKWIALGSVVAGLGLVGLISIAVHRRAVVSVTWTPVVPTRDEGRSIAKPAVVSAPSSETRTTIELAPLVLPSPAPPPARRRFAPAPVGVQSVLDDTASSLAAELRMIERAQAAQREGRPRDALSAIDEHEARFPRGALADEAAVLRIEANAIIGEATLAERLVSQFLATHPHSPYEPRVRRIMGALEDAGSLSPRP